MTSTTLELPGCTPEPLMNYLKALGVLRLVAEQADPQAAGCWRNAVFVLRSQFDRDELCDFFAARYEPTPILSPWNGDGGFLTDAGASYEALRSLKSSSSARLASMRRVIDSVEQVHLLTAFGAARERAKELDKKKKARRISAAETEELAAANKRVKELKNNIVTGLRNDLPDETLAWLDACMVIESEGFAASPVLGSGGVDGRMEFSANFLSNVLTVLEHPDATDWLRHALFGEGAARLLNTAIGQFAPGRIGGPNATQGMEGDSLLNPWDFVLMIEGVVLLSGSVSRKLGRRDDVKGAFPFTVRSAVAGNDVLASGEAREARGELWLPLWDAPSSLSETRALFCEGRAELGGRQARTAVDFARAVASLGVDRGIRSFSRQGFLKRNGLAYLATPLGRIDVLRRESVHLLRDIDPWLDRFRRACVETAPARFHCALRRIDSTIFDYCRYGGSRLFAVILRALGNAERDLATGESFRIDRTTGRTRVAPLDRLSPQWIDAANDGSAEFHLALALAGIFDRESKTGPLRCNLEPYDWTGRFGAWAEKDRRVVWNSADLAANLAAVLERRHMDANRAGCRSLPIESKRTVPLALVAAFIAGSADGASLDHERLEELLWGLMLVNRWDSWPRLPALSVDAPPLSRAYALLKLLFLPRALAIERDANGNVTSARFVDDESAGRRISPEPSILPLLRSDRVGEACRLAARRLRAAGLQPVPHRTGSVPNRDADWLELSTTSGKRLAAALLLPVSETAVRQLLNLVLRPEEDQAPETLDSAGNLVT